MITAKAARNVIAWIVGTSRWETARISSRPMPGNRNTASITTTPEMMPATKLRGAVQHRDQRDGKRVHDDKAPFRQPRQAGALDELAVARVEHAARSRRNW